MFTQDNSDDVIPANLYLLLLCENILVLFLYVLDETAALQTEIGQG